MRPISVAYLAAAVAIGAAMFFCGPYKVMTLSAVGLLGCGAGYLFIFADRAEARTGQDTALAAGLLRIAGMATAALACAAFCGWIWMVLP